MSTLLTKKLIGKEFLIKNEEWYYVNFNPFIDNYNLNNITDSNTNYSTNINFYIFDKVNFNEPNLKEFLNFKKIKDILSFIKPEKENIGITLLDVPQFKNENSYLATSTYALNERNLEVSIGPNEEDVKKIILNETSKLLNENFNSYFVIIEIPIIGTKKNYVDIPTDIENALILIPSNLCYNLNNLNEIQKLEFEELITYEEKVSYLINSGIDQNYDIILSTNISIIEKSFKNLTPIDNSIIPLGFTNDPETIVDISEVLDPFNDDSGILKYSFNDTTDDLGNTYNGSGYHVIPIDSTEPNKISLTDTKDIFGDGSCKGLFKFANNTFLAYNNFTGSASNLSYIAGKFGNCVVFNGTSSFISVDNQGNNLWPNTNKSLSVWIRSSAATLKGNLIYKGGVGETQVTNNDSIFITSDSAFRVTITRETGSGVDKTWTSESTTKINDGEWHHLVFNFSTNDLVIYVDGEFRTKITGLTLSDSTAPSLVIGKSLENTTSFLNADLNQMRFFNRLLALNEIRVLTTEMILNTPKFIDTGVEKFPKALVVNKDSYFASPFYLLGTPKFSITTWMKQNSLEVLKGYSSGADNVSIFSFHGEATTVNQSNGVLILFYNNISKIFTLRLRNHHPTTLTQTFYDTDSVDINFQEWNHFALTFDNILDQTNPKIYVNGVEIPFVQSYVNVGENPFTGFDRNFYFTPGRYHDYLNAWYLIHDLLYANTRMFNKELNNEEIIACYHEGYSNSDLLQNVINFEPLQIKTKFKNVLKGKIFKRYQEEFHKDLFYKAPQTLKIDTNTIHFYNGKNSSPYSIQELNTPVILPKGAEAFLKWLEVVCYTTNLDEYNNYIYIPGVGGNTTRTQDMIIPELIFNILGTKNLYSLNSKLLGDYLEFYPSNTSVDPNKILNKEFIDKVLRYFINARIYNNNTLVNNSTPIIYNEDGIVLPKFNKISYSEKNTDIGYIFFPQRHQNFGQDSKYKLKNFPPIPSSHKYINKIENISSCIIEEKDQTKPIDMFTEMSYADDFDYFLSPTGSDANNGLTINSPKASLNGIPAGKKVLLLPGTYGGTVYNVSSQYISGYQTGYRSSQDFPEIFRNFNGQNIYGCGDNTVISFSSRANYADLQIRISHSMRLFGPLPNLTTHWSTSGKFMNFKLIWDVDASGAVLTSEQDFVAIHSNGVELCNINVSIPPGRYYSQRYATWKNSTFTGGTRIGTPNPSNSKTLTGLDDIIVNRYDKMFPTNKTLINNITQSYRYRPIYTLVPLTDDISEEKSLVLEDTQSVSFIKDMDYRI